MALCVFYIVKNEVPIIYICESDTDPHKAYILGLEIVSRAAIFLTSMEPQKISFKKGYIQFVTTQEYMNNCALFNGIKTNLKVLRECGKNGNT